MLRLLLALMFLLAVGGLVTWLLGRPTPEPGPGSLADSGPEGASGADTTAGALLQGRSDGSGPSEAAPSTPEAVPPEGGRLLRVRVRAEDTKEPLAGARLHLHEQTTPPHAEPVATSTVGEDGRGEIPFPRGGWWYAEVVAEGYEAFRITLPAWQTGTTQVEVGLVPAGIVRGRVLRADGGARHGEVWLVDAEGQSQRAFERHLRGPGPTPVDVDGQFEIRGVRHGESFVVKTRAKDGASGTSQAFRLDTSTPFLEGLVLHAVRTGGIRARLLRHDGRPLDGGRVFLRFLSIRRDDQDGREGPVGAGGRVAFDDLPPGRYTLSLLHQQLRHAPITSEPIVIRPGEVTVLGEVRLGTGLRIAGRLVGDGAGAESFRGLRLKLFDDTHTFWTYTEEGGAFVFHDVDPGRYHLEVDSEGTRLREPATVEAGERELVLSALPASATLLWRVSDPAGEPVEFFETYVVDHGPPGSPVRQQYDGEEGELETSLLPPGAYDLILVAHGLALWRREGVVLTRGETLRVDVALAIARTVRRQVLGANGEPVAGAQVVTTTLADVPFGPPHESHVDMHHEEAVTDADGFFEVLETRPDLTLTVWAEGHGGVRLDLGELPKGPLRLPVGTAVAGRLVDAEGRNVAGVHLSLDRSGRHTYLSRSTRSASDGTFQFEDCAPGAWRLRVHALVPDIVHGVDVEVGVGPVDLGTVRLP